MRVFVSDGKENTPSIGSFQKRPVDNNNAAAVGHRVLTGAAN
jgi:hypothetical protein